MALVVELVIGQFEFVEAYNLAHPRLTGSRRIRMDVDPWRDRRVGVTRYHPLRAVIHVPWNGGKKSVSLYNMKFRRLDFLKQYLSV